MAFEHIQTVLTNAGISAEDVKTLNELPADTADFKADDFVAKLRTNFDTQLRNDPNFWNTLDENNVNETFKKKIEAQQYGRAANIVRQKTLKAFGLKEEDFADMPEEDRKRLETFIGTAAEKYTATKAGDKQLQKDLIDARKKIEAMEAEAPEKESALKTKYDTDLNNEKIDFIVMAEIASVPGLKAPAHYIADKIAAEMKSQYAIVVSGMKAVPMQKSNPSLRVVDGTKELGMKDLITKILTRENLVDDKAPVPDPTKGRVTIEPEDGKLVVSPHILAKIKENQ